MTERTEEKFEIHEILNKLRLNLVANNGVGRFFKCQSGDQLYYRVWESSNQEKIVVAIHGMGAHSEYYVQVADQLIDKGISVYALDVKHHGLTSGKKGDLKDFGEILSQIHELITKIRKDNNNSQVYLIGLSMGGMLTVNYSVLYPEDLAGIVLFAPGVSSNFKLKGSDIAKLPLLIFAFIFIKGKPIVNIAKRAAVTSRNPLRLEYQEKDPYRIKKLSVRFLFNMAKGVKKAFNNASKISHPTLLLQGTEDQLVSLDGVKEFFENIPIQDKTLVVLEGAYHSLFSDPAMQEQNGWDKLISWIKSH